MLVVCTVLSTHAWADSMRCGVHLVTPGDTKPEVLQHCGEPELREVVSGANEPRVEQWYYKRGVGQFPRVLTFEGIRLVRIEIITRP